MGVLRALIAFNFPTELPRVSCRGRLARCLHRALPGETAQTVLGGSSGGLRLGSGAAVSGRYCSQRGNLGGSSSSSSLFVLLLSSRQGSESCLVFVQCSSNMWVVGEESRGSGGGLQLAPGHQGPESVLAEMLAQFKKREKKWHE